MTHLPHSFSFATQGRRPESPAIAAAFAAIKASTDKYHRYCEAVRLLADHWFPGMTEETAVTVLGLHRISLTEIGVINLRDLVEDARRAAAR